MVCASLLGADIRTAKTQDAGPVLADTLRQFLFDLNVDDGLSALGYSKDDIPSLVKGTLPQVRCTIWPSCLLRTELEGNLATSRSRTRSAKVAWPLPAPVCSFMW